MPPLNRQILRVLSVIFAMLPLALFAKEPLLPKEPMGFKMAFEIELQQSKLANLMHLFDFQALERYFQSMGPDTTAQILNAANVHYEHTNVGEGDITKNYLRDNPRAFRALPEELQAELSQGLTLKSVVLEERKALVGTDQQPLKKRSSLILPGADSAPKPQPAVQLERPKLLLPGQNQAPKPGEMDSQLFHGERGLQVPNKLDWEELYRRWEKLPEERRRAAVQLELLSPRAKAAVFRTTYAVSPDRYDQKQLPLPLKEDVSEKDRDIFSRLEWQPDGDTMEFRYRGTVESSEKFLEDVTLFAGRADIKKEIFDPEGAKLQNYVRDETGHFHRIPKQWGSFHWHFSLPNRDLTQYATELNRNLLIRRLALGINDDLGRGQFRFSGISSKGLLTLQAENWIELRSHHELLEEELKRVISPLLLHSTADATKLLKQDTEAHLTDEIVRKLAASDLGAQLKGLDYPIARVIQELESELRSEKASLTTLKSLQALKPDSPAMGDFFEHWLDRFARDPKAAWDRDTAYEFLSWMKGPREVTARAELKLAQMLNGNDATAMNYALRAMRDGDWPKVPSERVVGEINKFVERISHSQFESSWDQDLLQFGLRYLKGRKDFLPVIEQILARPENPTIKHLVGTFLSEGFPRDAEVARKFGPKFLGLPASASSAEVQKAVIDRLGYSVQGWEMGLLHDTLQSMGPLPPNLKENFLNWYKVHSWGNANAMKLAYRVSENDPGLRSLVMESIKDSLRNARLNALDVVEELKIYDPEVLRLVKAYGDKGSTGMAVTVRRILEAAKAAKAASRSCPAAFGKLTKPKKGRAI